MKGQPKVVSLTETQFDARAPQLSALIQDWGERECTSFDDAVRRAAGEPEGDGGSIWEVPTIDSKRVVSLLIELEPALGCKLPARLIKRGGYSSIAELEGDLVPKLKVLAMSAKARPLAPTPSAQAASSSSAAITTAGLSGVQ